MISTKVSGSFERALAFGARIKRREQFAALAKYGQVGVMALAEATPKDTSDTAHSWTYQIVNKPGYFAIHWFNTNIEDGIPIVILLQYGHGTKNGGYVQGEDFINPALRSIFIQMADDMWKVVTK